MGKIIALANQKGGVGKTTTAVNLAAELGMAGKSVLLIDFDPQGNTTSGLGVDKKKLAKSIYAVIMNECTMAEATIPCSAKNVMLVPCDNNLAGAGIEIVSLEDRAERLKKPLLLERYKYDYILIDCPPSLELLTLNALNAADTVLIPTQCEFFALEGLSQLMNTVRLVKKLYNPPLDIEGVLLTMYDGRLNLHVEVKNEIKTFFGEKMYMTSIPRNVRLSEAPSHGLPVVQYDKHSRGAQSYHEFAQEFLSKGGAR